MRKFFVAAAAVFGVLAAPLQADIDGDLLAGLKPRLVGPAGMSGRIAAVDALASDPNFIVVGAASGGLWISHNGGLNFEPVFDQETVAAIGAVAINQQIPDIIWVGTGEGNTRNSTSIGGGVYRSLDGGKSFDYMGLKEVERIHRIALDPTDPDTVYVAALGKLWGTNKERGLYKTTDGGKTWENILYVDETTGATDVRMDPGNPKKLFASMWQFARKPYEFKSGGPGSGLYVTYDAGETWTKLREEDGLPKGDLGRSSFAIARSNPNIVYALVEAKKSALIRSDNGGKSWKTVNSDYDINDRPFYYNDLMVDPQNPNHVLRVGSRVKESIDGGKTFSYIAAINCCAASNTVHIDTHAWWINPNDPRHMIDGNDGGIAITRDGGDTWRFVRNLPLAQFYHIAVDDAVPYNIMGGLQDNGSWRGPSEVFENGGIRNFHWQEVAFGDGFDTQPDPEIEGQGYAMFQGGNLVRWNLNSGEMRLIKPNAPDAETELRFNWDSAFAQDPSDAATIYYGSQFVHKSMDRGKTWEIISGDLTTNNADWQTYKQSGGLTPDVTAAENFTTIVSIAVSPLDANVIWVGTDDGRLHLTQDGCANWENLDGKARGVPKNSWVKFIEPSRFDASEAFVVFDNHRRNDMTPYVYKAERFGKKFSKLATDDLSGYALSIRQDVEDPNLLFVGTEFGLYLSLDGGKSFDKWGDDFPTASVMDMAIQTRENDLVVGTHGRAAWVIDDYSGLRNLSADDFEARFKLLSVADAQQYEPMQTPSTRFPASGEFRAKNEAYGAMITFMASGEDLPHPNADKEKDRKAAARTKPKEDDGKKEGDAGKDKGMATITVADASGTVIRTFKQKVHQGINRAVWNLRADGIKPALPAKGPKDGTLPAGIEVLPGSYTVTISFDGAEASATAEVLKDPRTTYADADRAANHAARVEFQAMQARVNAVLNKMHKTRRDITTIKALAKDAGDDEARKALMKKANTLETSIKALEDKIRVRAKTPGIVYDADRVQSQLFAYAFYIVSTFDAPAANSAIAKQVALSALEAVEAEVAALYADGGDVAKFRDAVDAADISLLND